MPYKTIKSLPENLQDILPKHAQEIYQAAFNDAWDQYQDPEKRRGDDSREDVAAKVAWSAVKQKYEKKDGRWQEK